MYLANINNKSDINYFVALGYMESRGTCTLCSGILYSVMNCWAEKHLTANVL
jgi:hypothetical protein